MIKLISLILITLLCSLLPLSIAQDSNIFPYNHPLQCNADEYFDVNYLQCKLCNKNESLVPSVDGFGCSCHRNNDTIIVYNNQQYKPTCGIFSNRSSISCDPPGQYNLTVGLNVNDKREMIILIESNQNNKQIDMVPLDQINGTACDPKTHSYFMNKYCIPNSMLKSYNNYNNFKSHTIYDDLRFYVFMCDTMKMIYHCNYLANLCVLSHYSVEVNSPCSLFFVQQTPELGGFGYDVNTRILPFIFYKKGRSTADELTKQIDRKYIEPNGRQENEIEIIQITSTFKQPMKRYTKFNLNHLDFCGKLLHHKDPYIRIGKNYHNKCDLDALEFIRQSQPNGEFIQLYLNYTENNLNIMRSIPVLIRDTFANNMETDVKQWQFVKRFFIIDLLTHQNSLDTTRYNVDATFKDIEHYKVRYLRRAELKFKLSRSLNYNKIYLPILILDYDQINLTIAQHGPANRMAISIPYEFRITYNISYDLSNVTHILITVLIILAFLLALIRAFSYKVRQQKDYYDLEVFIHFVIHLLSYVANALFGYVLIISIYLFVAYKTQHILKILLPSEHQDIIEAFIFIAIALKSVAFIYHFVRLGKYDIFLLDWEKPKLYENHLVTTRNTLDTPSMCSSNKLTTSDGVSAWRNYFIANEWVKLSGARKISMYIHTLLIILTFYIFGFIGWSSTDFELSLDGYDEMNQDTILQVAVGIIVYIFLYTVQRLISFLFWERYIRNSLQQFVDVCSMSNISVFILTDETYGYYVHGRSPHGFADTDMSTMVLQLKREQNNMCGHRGLMPNSEQQTYTIYIPKNMRVLYNKLLAPALNPYQSNMMPMLTGMEFGKGKDAKDQSIEKVASIYQNINRFICAFIDHALRDLDYVIEEKSIVEKFLSFETGNSVTNNRGVFYLDSGHSFDSVLIYGNEGFLFKYELMIFITVLVLSNNFLAASLFVGSFSIVFLYLMQSINRNNLARKSIIDKRFLM